MNTGKNITFPIYSANGQPFHNLVLHKATYESVIMSLGDKITGDVYYKNNKLDCKMQEYIVFDGVKFTLVNPPTIVREGMVADNSELKGMTKYSFEFYHPMYVLNNIPFTDVAVSDDDKQYKSQDRTFTWVGYVGDFVRKLNKNLQNTEWVCEIDDDVIESSRASERISEVLSFDNNTIADALKTEYDTWDIPFIIDVIDSSDSRYNEDGKRFLIHFGNPVNEIYESTQDEENENPFVFKFGQGVGLKNNSATPRNNKIITRIAGYGSDRNVPFGYPQILWTGNQDWEYTINNDSTNPLSYPIYKGIVGGAWVKLIKHPFTRSHLMPTIYSQLVAQKVDPNNEDYNPDTVLIDYHDASDSSVYPNTINVLAPSYESHEFDDIYPRLGEESIVDCQPMDEIPNGHTPISDVSWDDSMDDDGNYVQSYFLLTLPQLDFDLYACAAITQEMQINMRTGACIGCTFNVQVDWDDYKVNFYDSDGNFLPNGNQRDLIKYPKSNNGEITIICQKDNETFGTLMPNIYQHPKPGDKFVILGISLPTSYITNAQRELDDAMDEYMLENNVYYYDYPLKFDEYFLVNNTNILSQIKNNTIIRFEFGDVQIPLYVKQITVTYGDAPLPQYNITLTDDVDIVLNQIGQVTEDVSKMRVQVSALQSYFDKTLISEIKDKLSKTQADTASGVITFLRGLKAGDFLQNSSGAGLYVDSYGNWHFETDYLNIRKKLEANEVEILKTSHIGGRQVLSPASMVISNVELYNSEDELITGGTPSYYRCYFNTQDGEGQQIYNTFREGDQALCQTFNLYRDADGVMSNHYWWRLVIRVGVNYIDVCNETTYEFDEREEGYTPTTAEIAGYDLNSGVPKVGDQVTSLGNRIYEDRQNAIVLAGAGEGNPFMRLYKGVNTFNLPSNKVVAQISPSGSWITVSDGNGNEWKVDELIESLSDKIDNVQSQTDKQMVLWFGDEVPTLQNEPAVDWDTNALKEEHLYDMYYNRASASNGGGRAYEFINDGTYKWVEITNQDIIKSLEAANDAQVTADGKRRVFVSQPTTPYDVGDLWVNAVFPTGSGTYTHNGTTYNASNPLFNDEILVCSASKDEDGVFSIADWMLAQGDWKSQILQLSDRISLTVSKGELEVVGIHLDGQNSKITLNASTTEVSDDLIVKRLETKPDTTQDANNQAKVAIGGSTMEVFGGTGLKNIEFGVDANGYAVLKYFDNDGNLLYDLGPNGLNYVDVSQATMTRSRVISMTTHLSTYLYLFHAKRFNGVIYGDDVYTNNDQQKAQEYDGKWFTVDGALNDNYYANGEYTQSNSTIIYSAFVGTISQFKNQLIAQGLPSSQANSFDWSYQIVDGNQTLDHAIVRQRCQRFINGVRSDYDVWSQNS